MRLLVVEDDDAGRALIGEALRDRRYTVIEAADGPGGLRLLQSDEPFDLLVTDIGLPGLNGRQLAEAARQARPGLPVLLITGDAGTALKDWALPPGMRILRKPFSLELLVDTIGAMLAPRTVPRGDRRLTIGRSVKSPCRRSCRGSAVHRPAAPRHATGR